MKIISLQAENVKRIRAVEISPPDKGLVEITGANGAGKSSVLDAIWWAVAGKKSHQEEPIRQGEDTATIRLDMGDIVVHREFSRGTTDGEPDGRTVTRLIVESADGARYPSPQAMLDQMLGSLSFDPLAFARLEGSAQLKHLQSFVSGIDWDADAAADADAVALRREHRRTAKDARLRAEHIDIPEVVEDDSDPDAIQTELNEALEFNLVQIGRENAIQVEQQQIEEIEKNRGRLQARIDEIEKRLEKERRGLEIAGVELMEAESRIAQLPVPEERRDVMELSNALKQANRVQNARAERRVAIQRREDFIAMATEAEAKLEELTEAIAARARAQHAAIAETELPVPGLSLSATSVMFEGVPFKQASDAEQLRVSSAMAMAAETKLRILRIRDGSLLDEHSLENLRQLAIQYDYQVWIERVDTSGTVGIVIEDGRVADEEEAT